ncbi:membrane or secreted protein [Spirosoma sp. BT702]|uniref:Membrane or secreted protein n=1 Tax=Spirosoma profusum TaxID=2771354 RepID=A0A927AT87_9BACT|nr:membrane or secreted protein [Spirosoma profusum]MBD2702885.1 membrane or secreted protein [Spirosoma profusum]
MKLKQQSLWGMLMLLTTLSAFRWAEPTEFDGAWQFKNPDGALVMLTIADNYFVQTTYQPARYISTRGGVCKMDGKKLSVKVEFDSEDSSRVGQTELNEVELDGNKIIFRKPGVIQVFEKITETATPLTGLWRITGRANDAGQITTMQRGARKTLKLLTGSRFQWIAINPETKQFSGTGGGTYTLKDGNYTETIEFFSRDNSRVGKSLTFGAKINGDQWNHTGESSTGGKVNEIWSREK